jgi:hypothetical protein
MKALLILLALLTAPAMAQAPSGRWTPTPQMIARIEAQVRVPAGADDLHTARRIYWGVEDRGHRTIVGRFVRTQGQGSITILQAGDPVTYVADGGCGIVMVSYDMFFDRVTKVTCNGVA